MNRILKIRTALPSYFKGFSGELVIGLGSCLDQDLPQPIWKDIKSQNPEIFIMLGDNVYGDTHGNIHNLERAYQKQDRAFKKQDLNSLSWQSGMIMIMGKMMEELSTA